MAGRISTPNALLLLCILENYTFEINIPELRFLVRSH